MKKNKLISAGLTYTIGNLLVQGLSFITLPLYTRMMDIHAYGSYNLYMSWVSMFAIFIGLQVNGSYSIAKLKYQDDFEDYVSTSVIISTIFFGLILAIIMMLDHYVELGLGFSQTIIIFILFQAYFTHLQGSYSQYYIQKQQSIKQLTISVVLALSNLFITVTLLFTISNQFMARILGGFIPNILVGVFFIFFIFMNSKYIFNKKYISFLLTTSVPLIFHILGHSLLNQLDRIMIGKYMNTSEVAIYSFGYAIGLIIQIVLSSLNTAWVPWFFDQKRRGNEVIIQKYKKQYIVLAVFLTIGYLTIFPELIAIMGKGQYLNSKYFVAWIIVSYFIVFLYTFPVNIQFYNENTKFIPLGTLMAAGSNYILNIFFIQYWGIYGAAIATVLSYLLLLLFHHLITKVKYNYTDIGLGIYGVLILLVSSYAVFINIFINNLIIRWLTCFLISIVLVIYYRKELKKILKKDNI